MEVEDVTRVRLTTRRPAKQQRHLAVGPCMLGEVVVNDQDIFTLVHEVLGHSSAGVRSQVLQRGGVRGVGGDHDRVVERTVVTQRLSNLRNLTDLLADTDVDADNAGVFLVDDGVDTYRCLAGVAVSNDQLTLSTTDRYQAVDALNSKLKRSVHRLPHHDVRRQSLDRHRGGRIDRASAVQRPTQRVNDPAHQVFANRDFSDATRASDLVAFFDARVLAENHGSNAIFFKVQCHADGVIRELQQLRVTDIGQAVNSRHAVGRPNDRTNVDHGQFATEFLDLALDDRGYVLSSDRHAISSVSLFKKPCVRDTHRAL